MMQGDDVPLTHWQGIDALVERKNAMFWRVTQGLVMYVTLFFAAIWYWVGNQTGALICFVTSCIALALQIAHRMGVPFVRLRTALRFLVIGCVYFFAVASWHQSTAVAAYFIVVPVGTMLFAERSIAVRWLIVSILAIISLPYSAQFITQLPSLVGPVHDAIVVIQLVVLCVVLFVISLLSHSTNQDLIAQLTQSHQNLQFTHAALVDSQKTKDRFFASISHEIRTPMNAIQGISQLLQQAVEKSQPMDAELVRDLRRSSNHLIGILNDLLDFSKMNENKLILRPSWIELKKICDDVMSIVRHDAQAKGLQVTVDFDRQLPKKIYIDGVRFRQIIVNLVNNAIKFTEQGIIRIRCDLLHSVTGHEILQVSVQDPGMGIAPEFNAKIFESYEQSDSGAHRRYAGSGLGLAICKQILEMQNGRIWFDSEVGQGTTFYIQLPLRKHHDEAPGQDLSNEVFVQPSLSSPACILIVDDNSLNVMVAQKLLKAVWPQTQICVAQNGQLAIEELIKNQPDVVLMDLYMPDMDGFEATEKIRALINPKLSNTPIIAMSANMPDLEINKAIHAGVNDYVMKPFVVQNLVDKILLHIR